jgi:integrase
MASIANDPNGTRRILFVDSNGSRKTIRLGKVAKRDAQAIKLRVESLLASKLMGSPIDRDTAAWLAGDGEFVRERLERVGLVEPVEKPNKGLTLAQFLEQFMVRNGAGKKPATRVVWGQVIRLLNKLMPNGIMLHEVTAGHAKQFLTDLRKLGTLSPTTIHKRVGFAKQFFADAVDWQLIERNPFAAIKTQASSVKANVEVSREVIELVLRQCDTDWQTIVGLSRFGGLRCPSEVLSLRWIDIDWEKSRMSVPEPKVEHYEGRGVRSVPIFPELLPILQAAWDAAPEGAEFVVGKQAYRDAAMREGGWANANLRTQFEKRLKKAGIAPWARLFHSMRASRQTELERDFPRHVVCGWMGNSSQVAERSYLLVTEADFAKATTPNGAQSGALVAQNGAKSGAADSRTESHQNEKTVAIPRESEAFPGNHNGLSMEDNGLEPMTSCMPCKRSTN